MKFLADVNVDRNIVVRLWEAGHEVEWLAESATNRRLKDPLLMQHAYQQEQVILTNDTGFSRYVFHDRLPTHGVILLRVANKRTRLPNPVALSGPWRRLGPARGTVLGSSSPSILIV